MMTNVPVGSSSEGTASQRLSSPSPPVAVINRPRHDKKEDIDSSAPEKGTPSKKKKKNTIGHSNPPPPPTVGSSTNSNSHTVTGSSTSGNPITRSGGSPNVQLVPSNRTSGDSTGRPNVGEGREEQYTNCDQDQDSYPQQRRLGVGGGGDSSGGGSSPRNTGKPLIQVQAADPASSTPTHNDDDVPVFPVSWTGRPGGGHQNAEHGEEGLPNESTTTTIMMVDSLGLDSGSSSSAAVMVMGGVGVGVGLGSGSAGGGAAPPPATNKEANRPFMTIPPPHPTTTNARQHPPARAIRKAPAGSSSAGSSRPGSSSSSATATSKHNSKTTSAGEKRQQQGKATTTGTPTTGKSPVVPRHHIMRDVPVSPKTHQTNLDVMTKQYNYHHNNIATTTTTTTTNNHNNNHNPATGVVIGSPVGIPSTIAATKRTGGSNSSGMGGGDGGGVLPAGGKSHAQDQPTHGNNANSTSAAPADGPRQLHGREVEKMPSASNDSEEEGRPRDQNNRATVPLGHQGVPPHQDDRSSSASGTSHSSRTSNSSRNTGDGGGGGNVPPVQEEEDEACCICLENYTVDNPKYFGSCVHHFHYPCLLSWKQRSMACPMCCEYTLADPQPAGPDGKKLANAANDAGSNKSKNPSPEELRKLQEDERVARMLQNSFLAEDQIRRQYRQQQRQQRRQQQQRQGRHGEQNNVAQGENENLLFMHRQHHPHPHHPHNRHGNAPHVSPDQLVPLARQPNPGRLPHGRRPSPAGNPALLSMQVLQPQFSSPNSIGSNSGAVFGPPNEPTGTARVTRTPIDANPHFQHRGLVGHRPEQSHRSGGGGGGGVVVGLVTHTRDRGGGAGSPIRHHHGNTAAMSARPVSEPAHRHHHPHPPNSNNNSARSGAHSQPENGKENCLVM